MTAAASAFRERHVTSVVEPRALGALWYAFFEGPDGVRVELIQRP